jgi:hypothetical protein
MKPTDENTNFIYSLSLSDSRIRISFCEYILMAPCVLCGHQLPSLYYVCAGRVLDFDSLWKCLKEAWRTDRYSDLRELLYINDYSILVSIFVHNFVNFIVVIHSLYMTMFWGLTPCGLVGGYQRFRASALKMETVFFSETLVSTYKSTRRLNPEHHHPHRREDFKSYIVCT